MKGMSLENEYRNTVLIGVVLAVFPYMLMRVGSGIEYLEAIGVRQLYDPVDMAHELAYSRVRHASDVNKVIHMLTNPVIFLTELVLLNYTPTVIGLPQYIGKYLTLNLAGIYLVFFVVYYLTIDAFAGTFAALYLIYRYACIGRFVQIVEKLFGDKRRAPNVALGLYILCHFFQIAVGHYMVEQHYDVNLYHTFFLQQLVAVYEVLFKIDARLELGYLTEFDEQVNGLLDAERESMMIVNDTVEAPEF